MPPTGNDQRELVEGHLILAQETSSSSSGPSNRHWRLGIVRAVFWIITACAGFLQAWAARFYVSPDGNSYLDIASAYLKGDWKVAINAYWSPLFSWLLAFFLWLLRPNPYWESTLLHLVNFLGLLVGLWSFEFFFRSFLKLQKETTTLEEEEDGQLPETAWWALGYAIFLSTSLSVLSLTLTTPDIWICAVTYLAMGLVLRIHLSGGGWPYFAVLGFVLGCGYLTKSFYFLLSFVFLGTAWLASRDPRKNLLRIVLAFVLFSMVSGPFVLALSRSKHRLTFGDAGRITYALAVDDLQQPPFWQGENETGTPKHPTRKILSEPSIYEFATPVGGSYLPPYDTSYWMDGVTPRFRLRGQLRVLRQSADTFFLILMNQVDLAVGLLMLIFVARERRACLRVFLGQWYVWLPAVLGCLGYAVVLVEGRYIAPYLPLLWIAAFSCCLRSGPEITRRVKVAAILAVLSVTTLRLAKFAVSDLISVLSAQENVNWEVAQSLHELGIQPDGKVSGLALKAEAHWARLAGVVIVSEIPLGGETTFWTAAPDLQRKVLDTLASTGAKIIVTKDPPACAINAGWIPLRRTGYYAFPLSVQNSMSAAP